MTGVAIWDVGAELRSRDRRALTLDAPLADPVSCRDLSTLKVGRGRYTPMASYDGILINDPIAMPIREDLWWLSIADSDVALFCAGRRRRMGFDVTVREPDVSPLAIQGPEAEDLVRDLLGDIVDEIGFFRFREVEASRASRWSSCGRAGAVRAASNSSPSERRSRVQELWDLAVAAGAAYGVAPEPLTRWNASRTACWPSSLRHRRRHRSGRSRPRQVVQHGRR